MDIERRGFLGLTVAAGAALTLATLPRLAHAAAASAPATKPADDDWGFDDDASTPMLVARAYAIGTLADYSHDGVYSQYRSDGFFVIRRSDQLWVLSAICPHRGCKVVIQPDGSYICPCHHSAFDSQGHVTKGPAKTDLSRLAVGQAPDGRLFVDSGKTVQTYPPPVPPSSIQAPAP